MKVGEILAVVIHLINQSISFINVITNRLRAVDPQQPQATLDHRFPQKYKNMWMKNDPTKMNNETSPRGNKDQTLGSQLF